MRPAEGDSAAEFARQATTDLVRALTGKRRRRNAGRLNDREAHGVLAEADDPADPILADLISKVLGNLLPAIASGLSRRRAAGPTLTNTDGHHLKFINAMVQVKDPAAAAERLAAHADFRTEQDVELTWWGRELSATDQESALATLGAEVGEDVEEPEKTPRWLRGRLRLVDGDFAFEINSEERLANAAGRAGRTGSQPELTRRSATDPPRTCRRSQWPDRSRSEPRRKRSTRGSNTGPTSMSRDLAS
jgi:hypothetical protein